MARRDAPNDYFAWYNDDDRLAIVVRQENSNSSKGTTSGEYDTYLDSSVTNGIRITLHSKYEAVSNLTDDLEDTCGLDSMMHASILDYVKSRVLEDRGDAQAGYFKQKYENSVSKKPTRKSGVRVIVVPVL